MIQELSQRIAGNEIPAILFGVVFAFAYFMPVLIAALRSHRFTLPIAAITVFLGWTGLGWLAAMIWAVNRDVAGDAASAAPSAADPSPREPSWSEIALRLDDAEPAQAVKTLPCAHCEEPVEADALFCRHCGREVAAAPAATAAESLDDGNLKDVYSVLSNADRDSAETEFDRKLLEVFDYARTLERRAAAGERAAKPSAEKPFTDTPSAEREIVLRTGTGTGS